MPAVEAEWFFSTVAQATAASIGFLIAFLAAQYTARKNKTQDNYSNLLNQLEEIEETYNPLLDRMERQLTGVTSFPSFDGTIESSYEVDISQAYIQSISDQYGQAKAIKMFANLKRSQKLLNQLILPQPNDLKRKYIRRLNETSKAMIDSIETNANGQSFLSDTSIGHLTPDQVRNQAVFPNAGQTPRPGTFNSQVDTSTFQSWIEVLRKFRQETVRAGMKAQNTELTVDFREYQMVLERLVTLFLIGVIFPLLFLFAWYPEWWISFEAWEITLIERVS